MSEDLRTDLEDIANALALAISSLAAATKNQALLTEFRGMLEDAIEFDGIPPLAVGLLKGFHEHAGMVLEELKKMRTH